MAELVNQGDFHRPLARRIPALVLIASGVLVVMTERDLRSRPSSEIRGPKLAWQVGSANALVALVYLRWGRRG
jgi:hypothetical protein